MDNWKCSKRSTLSPDSWIKVVKLVKILLLRERQLSLNAIFSVFCRNNYNMQIFIHLCSLHLHFYWYKHMHFNSNFYKPTSLWLLWLCNLGPQNVFTWLIIFLLFIIYQNIFKLLALRLNFLFSSKIPGELNSLSDYLLTVFSLQVWLYGTMQGLTLRVQNF